MNKQILKSVILRSSWLRPYILLDIIGGFIDKAIREQNSVKGKFIFVLNIKSTHF